MDLNQQVKLPEMNQRNVMAGLTGAFAIAAIYFTVLVSVISAVDYFVGFWKQIDHASKDRRKAFVLGQRKSPSIS